MKEVDFANYYGKWYERLLFRWVDRKKVSILKNDLDGKKLNVLDFGCGTAKITSQITGCKVHGVDNNEKLLKIAKANGVIAKFGDFEKLPYPSNYFDAVVSIDTIEHVYSREKSFNEIKRVLKPSGALYIFTPSYSSPLWVVAEKVVNFITGSRSGHTSPFTRESLEFFMAENFKKAERVKSVNFCLGLFAKAKFKK